MFDPKKKRKAYTLVEIMAVLAIIMIIMTTFVYQFVNFFRSSITQTTRDQILLDMRRARSDAVHTVHNTSLTGVDATWTIGYMFRLESDSEYRVYRWKRTPNDIDPIGVEDAWVDIGTTLANSDTEITSSSIFVGHTRLGGSGCEAIIFETVTGNMFVYDGSTLHSMDDANPYLCTIGIYKVGSNLPKDFELQITPVNFFYNDI